MATLLLGLLIVGLTAVIIVSIAACSRMHHTVEEIRKRLGAYFPESVASSVLNRENEQPMAKYFADATVIVIRISNFSTLIERLKPHAALRYINECHLLCGTTVHRNGGIIERFLEDGLVAVFGIEPQSRDDHAYRALRTGLEASRLVASMKARWESEGRRAFRISVGIHSGSLIAGDVGFGAQRSFALVGHTVIMAQQLQRLSEELNASVLTSGPTFEQVQDRFVAIPVKSMQIRHHREISEAYIVRSLAVGELVEELGLPPLIPLATEVADEAEFIVHEEAPRAAAIWQRLSAHPVQAQALDKGRHDAPIMPEASWAPLAMYEDSDGPPFDLRP